MLGWEAVVFDKTGGEAGLRSLRVSRAGGGGTCESGAQLGLWRHDAVGSLGWGDDDSHPPCAVPMSLCRGRGAGGRGLPEQPEKLPQKPRKDRTSERRNRPLGRFHRAVI